MALIEITHGNATGPVEPSGSWPGTFATLVDRFCAEQAEFRARLALAGGAAPMALPKAPDANVALTKGIPDGRGHQLPPPFEMGQ